MKRGRVDLQPLAAPTNHSQRGAAKPWRPAEGPCSQASPDFPQQCSSPLFIYFANSSMLSAMGLVSAGKQLDSGEGGRLDDSKSPMFCQPDREATGLALALRTRFPGLCGCNSGIYPHSLSIYGEPVPLFGPVLQSSGKSLLGLENVCPVTSLRGF